MYVHMYSTYLRMYNMYVQMWRQGRETYRLQEKQTPDLYKYNNITLR
jgi:hypothetical protein